jgi:hypothetical protein
MELLRAVMALLNARMDDEGQLQAMQRHVDCLTLQLNQQKKKVRIHPIKCKTHSPPNPNLKFIAKNLISFEHAGA